jgi:Uma2 family endonuclease
MTKMTDAPVKTTELTFEQFLIDYDGIHADLLPDGRVEVHMSTTVFHESVLGLLYRLLCDFLDFKPIGKVRSTSLVMRLRDDLPKREPDMTVVLNEHQDRLHETYIDGPANIVIEIVSLESAERDYVTKFNEYEAGGVPEYWLIDPQRRIFDIYALDASGSYHRLPTNQAGQIQSNVLPGFAFDPAVLWRDPPLRARELLALAEAMVGGNS